MTVVLVNKSTAEIKFLESDRGASPCLDFTIRVYSPSGKSLICKNADQLRGSMHFEDIEPGQHYRRVINLIEFYDLKESGTYTIQLQYNAGRDDIGVLTSNPVKICMYAAK